MVLKYRTVDVRKNEGYTENVKGHSTHSGSPKPALTTRLTRFPAVNHAAVVVVAVVAVGETRKVWC